MLFNLEDWENIIHFGNLFASFGKKTYFLALGTIPETGVGFIARKITDVYMWFWFSYQLMFFHPTLNNLVFYLEKKKRHKIEYSPTFTYRREA